MVPVLGIDSEKIASVGTGDRSDLVPDLVPFDLAPIPEPLQNCAVIEISTAGVEVTDLRREY